MTEQVNIPKGGISPSKENDILNIYFNHLSINSYTHLTTLKYNVLLYLVVEIIMLILNVGISIKIKKCKQ